MLIENQILEFPGQKRPLQLTLPSVQAFDPSMLPDAIKDYVMDVSDRQQCSPDFVAVAAVCGLSAVLGRKILMRPKEHDDWTVTPNQWGQIIGRPSAMKSPSMKEALKPLYLIEKLAAEQYAKDEKRHNAKRKLSEFDLAATEKEAKKHIKSGNREAALNLLENELLDTPTPTRPRLIVNDATVEKLGELLNQNPNGLILVRDELAGFLAKLAKEDGQGDRAFYLECFDGNGSYVYDRIGRGTIDIKSCTLSIIGGIQPSKLHPLLRDAIRGTSDDGLIQRFQLSVWPDDTGNWQWKDRAPDEAARARYFDAFNRLHRLPETHTDSDPKYLHFTEDAQTLFILWMEEIQFAARNYGECTALESYLLKMPQTIVGLALIFELVDGGCDAVSEASLDKAIKWAAYLKSHAERLYRSVINHAIESARLIVDRKDKLPNPFTSRHLQRRGWTGLNDIEAVTDALDCLIDHGYLTTTIENNDSEKLGRPSIEYRWC